MILRTSIYNHNYYPIKLSGLKQNVLLPDNITPHTQVTVNDTSFNEDLGFLIKPFQDIEYFTNIELANNVNKFADDIVFEQIFSTDSYDYSQFGNLSK